MNRFLLVILSLCCLSYSIGQVSEAKISIDHHHFKIGEQTNVSIEISSRQADPVSNIPFSEGIPLSNLNPNREDSISLEIIRKIQDTFYHDLDVSRTKLRYVITAWDTGKFMIPPHIFKINDEEIISMPVTFSVGTVKVDTNADIKDIKDILTENAPKQKDEPEDAPSKEASSWIKWGWIIAGVLILALIGFLIWFIFRKGKQEESSLPELLPHESALLRLQSLHQELNQGIDNKYYYSELTTVLRIYIENRYYIPSLEKTSKQLLRSLRSKELSASTYQNLKDLLILADLVKFAKAKPATDQNEINYLKAVAFVKETKPEDPSNEI